MNNERENRRKMSVLIRTVFSTLLQNLKAIHGRNFSKVGRKCYICFSRKFRQRNLCAIKSDCLILLQSQLTLVTKLQILTLLLTLVWNNDSFNLCNRLRSVLELHLLRAEHLHIVCLTNIENRPAQNRNVTEYFEKRSLLASPFSSNRVPHKTQFAVDVCHILVLFEFCDRK